METKKYSTSLECHYICDALETMISYFGSKDRFTNLYDFSPDEIQNVFEKLEDGLIAWERIVQNESPDLVKVVFTQAGQTLGETLESKILALAIFVKAKDFTGEYVNRMMELPWVKKQKDYDVFEKSVGDNVSRENVSYLYSFLFGEPS